VLVSNLGFIPISFPVMYVDPSPTVQPTMLGIDGKDTLPLSAITSLNTMAKRALRDDMPGIMLRGVIRATAKAMSQKALMDQGGNAAIAGLVLNVVNVVTESADERTWRTLPATISIGRMTLPSGKHNITIGNSMQTVDVQGSHTIVLTRLIGNQAYWSQPLYGPQMPVYTAPLVAVPTENNTPAIGREKPNPTSRKKKKSKK
jgi:hypothetical protein